MDLLNAATLETFQELMEPQELQDFLERARQELLRSHTLMQQHFAACEWPALRAVAHRLKGSLGSIGCDALFATLEQIELALLATPPEPPSAERMRQLAALADQTAGRLGAPA